MSDYERGNYLRLQAEGDRSDEFKEARGALVTRVNGWLEEMLRKREAGEPLADGTLIRDSERITRTDFGESGPNTHLMAEEYQTGVSVSGDGRTRPIALEAVRPELSMGITEVIEVQGVDPIARQVHGDEYSSRRRSEILAAFSVRELSRKAEQQFAYSVLGDGEIRRKFIENGGQVSRPLQTVSDIEMAQDAFEQITGSIA